MPERDEELEELDRRVNEAFQEAYPEVPADHIKHMSRNFTQVIRGILEIGKRIGGEGGITHMDLANSFVYWCVANTYLEDLSHGEWNPILEDPGIARISEEEMEKLRGEFVARAADWMLGMEILRQDEELYRTFIKGAIALGASDWETNRGKLHY